LHLFLTGATGLVGSEVLDRARAGGIEVTCLARNPAKLSGIAAVRGALSDFEADPRSVTAILHCAAETRFGLALDEVRAVNVAGTRRMLDFARRCPKLDRFGYVSTAFSCGALEGALEEVRWRPAAFSNSYQQSKWEAEELAFQAMRDLPCSVYRLSSIFGDSRTGAVKKFNYTHQLLRLFPKNILPIAPGIPDAPVDLLAADWAADTLFDLFADRFEAGSVRHVCAGRDGALTVAEMIELAAREFPVRPPIPRLVSLSEYRGFVEEVNRCGDKLLKETLRVLDFFLPHLGMRQEFAVSHGRTPPPIREFFPKVVRYCLDSNWGRG
jgi:nucleoside-diphosphate-sugar epimerase